MGFSEKDGQTHYNYSIINSLQEYAFGNSSALLTPSVTRSGASV
jgi:hypothetical protein